MSRTGPGRASRGNSTAGFRTALREGEAEIENKGAKDRFQIPNSGFQSMT
jgi:hypothetical protein